jgi:ATP-dependent RNA helicase DHX8/PRP22
VFPAAFPLSPPKNLSQTLGTYAADAALAATTAALAATTAAMLRSQDRRPFRPPDRAPRPPHPHRDQHNHNEHRYQPLSHPHIDRRYSNEHRYQPRGQHQRGCHVQPPLRPSQFEVFLVRPGPDLSAPTAIEVEALLAGLPSPAPASISVQSSGRHAARLVFTSIPAAAAAARELWALRLEGLHLLTLDLPHPALAAHASPLIASLFASHASRLLDSDIMVLSAARSAELEASVRDVKQRLGSPNRFRDFHQLDLEKKTLESEKEFVDSKIAEYKEAMWSIQRAMLRGSGDKEEGVDLFAAVDDGEVDFVKVHMMLLRECRRLKEGLPIYAYRRRILNHIFANQVTIYHLNSLCAFNLGLVRLLILHVYWSVLGGIGMDFDLLWI